MRVIDVHSHFVPVALPDFAARHADPRWPVLVAGDAPEIIQHGRRYREVDDSYYDINRRLEQLDELGIDIQVLSPLPVFLPFWADASRAHGYCMIYNDLLAEACAQHPTRFLGFGVVPLQDPALAVQEIGRLKGLGLAGIEFGTWIGDGRGLDEPSFEEVFLAAADAGLPVLLHPNNPAPFGVVVTAPVLYGVGVGCETARTVASLQLSGTLHRCAGLRLCLAHGGGAFLWLWPRFRAIAERSGARDDLPGCLFIDTAALDRANLAYITNILADQKVLLGTDMPACTMTGARNVIEEVGSWDPGLIQTGQNADRFIGL